MRELNGNGVKLELENSGVVENSARTDMIFKVIY
jgi:hypothetical protein